MLSGTRVAVRSEKKDPRDFALWKHAEPGHLMRWRDCLGQEGFPGWHTECVAMSGATWAMPLTFMVEAWISSFPITNVNWPRQEHLVMTTHATGCMPTSDDQQ